MAGQHGVAMSRYSVTCPCGWSYEQEDTHFIDDSRLLTWYVEHIQLCGESKLHHVPTTFMGHTTLTTPIQGIYNS